MLGKQAQQSMVKGTFRPWSVSVASIKINLKLPSTCDILQKSQIQSYI